MRRARDPQLHRLAGADGGSRPEKVFAHVRRAVVPLNPLPENLAVGRVVAEVAALAHLERVRKRRPVQRPGVAQRDEPLGRAEPVDGGQNLAVQRCQALRGGTAGGQRRGGEKPHRYEAGQRDDKPECSYAAHTNPFGDVGALHHGPSGAYSAAAGPSVVWVSSGLSPAECDACPFAENRSTGRLRCRTDASSQYASGSPRTPTSRGARSTRSCSSSGTSAAAITSPGRRPSSRPTPSMP